MMDMDGALPASVRRPTKRVLIVEMRFTAREAALTRVVCRNAAGLTTEASAQSMGTLPFCNSNNSPRVTWY